MKTMTSNMDTTTMDTTRTMKKGVNLGLAVFVAASIMLCYYDVWAGATQARNPPECDKNSEDCGCDNGEEVTPACIKVNLALGETTPWTRSMSCALKIFADSDSPNVFSQDSLYAVLGGYTFKRLGTKNLSDGVTPAEVVLAHPQGEPIHFIFKDGESMARPDPGVHIKMDERLQMVDAEGWAATHDPVYYDLYVGDGSRRRFLATDMTGALGSLVSITDARGVTVTPADMGIDIIYDANGVRQFLTPSRLADVIPLPGFKGFEVKVYALQTVPQKNAATGLYVPPQATPVKHLTVSPENGWRHAIVTLKSGDNDPRRYVFDYALSDWSMTRSSGVEERKERFVDDGRAAYIKNEVVAADGTLLSRKVKNYAYESWGFAMTNKVEGFGGVTDTTSWTYYTSGNGKGQVKTERRQSGLLIQYAYDNLDRVISETRSGPDMMTEVTTYDYSPVDPSDPILPVDTRPRTIVRKLNGIECERTYYVYSPFTNIVERVGTQGAPYGGTNALRTVTAYYPVVAGDVRSGRVRSVRREDGRLDLYDYALVTNVWTETVTHLHEQSTAPVSGRTTRDVRVSNRRGETLEQKTEAFVGGIWYTISRNRMTYNLEGKRVRAEDLAGRVTATEWNCCHKVAETRSDGSATAWDYDGEGRLVAASRLIPLDLTNVTWLTTCYSYDDLGRQTASWTTNFAAHVGLPATKTRYDALGRVGSRVDALGNATVTSYSPDGRTVSVQNPNSATTVSTRSPDGDLLSITGTAVTPEFRTYGVLPDGTRWTRTVQGESPDSPRFMKRYENMLGQVVREERSGFRGAVLATVHEYDAYGRLVRTSSDGEPTTTCVYDDLGSRVATVRSVGGAAPSAPLEWRKSETLSNYAVLDSYVWLVQTNVTFCSDAAIAPLITTQRIQLTGLATDLPSRVCTTDIRGNVTESWTDFSDGVTTARRRVPEATNIISSRSRFGVSLESVSVSAVTNRTIYDALGRVCMSIDGRGNATRTEYDPFGRRAASFDGAGNPTRYAYDRFGNLVAVTNALGHATVYEYDLRGRKTYEGGATYPVRYTYDVFGNKVSMTTYRNETDVPVGGIVPNAPNAGDTTRWLYDEASGAMTNKVYADGKGPRYDYDANGRLTKRTWARGIDTFYAYDGWGNLTNTTYTDNTPTVALRYDALGRPVEAHDAAGVTTFAYDAYGANTNETVIGVAGTNVLERFNDGFGRDAGYALNGERQTLLKYDAATSRLTTMQMSQGGSGIPTASNGCEFHWTYLSGSNLKTSLQYPNGLTASWQYDANNQLLQVRNAMTTNVISQFDYTYDAAGRRIQIAKSGCAFDFYDVVSYGYNARSELTNAVSAVDANYRYSYRYDPIGNRETSSERGTNTTYAANELNQYTQISVESEGAFIPEFDDDGNQALVKTATGIWSVIYNGENRPVLWTCGTTNIVMSYDRMGRRITKNGQRFAYNGYLQIANISPATTTTTSNYNSFVWDPTEPVATRPLAWNFSTSHPSTSRLFFYTHDGNKNISDVIAPDVSLVAHYEYASFGELIVCRGTSAATNPWRFSSEYYDQLLNLMQYVFRNYSCLGGAFLTRDIIDHENLYLFVNNRSVDIYDYLGLLMSEETCESILEQAKNEAIVKEKLSALEQEKCPVPSMTCACCNSEDRAFYSSPKADWRFLWLLKDSGEIRICRNNSKYSAATTISDVAEILEHELIHAMQSCKGKLGDNCEKRICAEIQAYLPRYRRAFSGFDNMDKKDKIALMLDSIVGSCGEICKGKANLEDFVNNYMVNFFEECAK